MRTRAISWTNVVKADEKRFGLSRHCERLDTRMPASAVGFFISLEHRARVDDGEVAIYSSLLRTSAQQISCRDISRQSGDSGRCNVTCGELEVEISLRGKSLRFSSVVP